ncbi:MAG: phenylacetate-CoA oxygenase subunit PaaJ [Gammaproteobacteria bacterium]|nr:phenylacetate-CoA oxygenase subunit PaaJ [Gammaproteobacteria bacterium]
MIDRDLVALETPEYVARRARRDASDFREVFDLLDAVRDPELPELSIWDLGVLRDVRKDEVLVVAITPTYSGCPALDVIRQDIVECLRIAGIDKVEIEDQVIPAWSTDLMSQAARTRLRSGGVAPPAPHGAACPVCGSVSVEVISQFGSTACKALYRCLTCREPFDYFKEH